MNTTRDPILPNELSEEPTLTELRQWRKDVINILKDLHNTVYDDLNGTSDYLDSLTVTMQDAIIPVGFIYTQLPGKDDPDTVFGFGSRQPVNVYSTFISQNDTGR